MTKGITQLPMSAKPFDKLPKRIREFIRHYIECGDAYSAYLKAGYKESRAGKAQARKILSQVQPHIRAQLADYVSGTEMAIMSIKALRQLALSAESEQVRLNAAKELLQRALPEGPKEVHHHHTSDKEQLTDDQLLLKLKKLQDRLFIDAPAIEVADESGTRGVRGPSGGVGEAEEVQSAVILGPIPVAD